jgi:hypothetical protein
VESKTIIFLIDPLDFGMQMVDDRISALSDEIICHILSFVPTEDVFKTNILSKRWRPLRLLIPNLDFDDRRWSRELYPRFLYMVYATIYARSLQNPIKRFCLRCDGNSIYEPLELDVKTWLTAAAKRGMEHLDVHISDRHNFNCVFSFKNLVVLKLNVIHITTTLSVDLPLLKTLHLNGVYFSRHWLLLQILDGCPILEDFEAKNIFVRNSTDEYDEEFKRLTKLVKADISNLSVFNVPLEGFSNVEFLRLEEVRIYIFSSCYSFPISLICLVCFFLLPVDLWICSGVFQFDAFGAYL